MTKPALGMKCTACAADLTSLDLNLTDDLLSLEFCCPRCHTVFGSVTREEACGRHGKSYHACIRALERVVVIEASAPRWQRRGGQNMVAKNIYTMIVTPKNVSLLMDRAFRKRAADEHNAALQKGS